MSRTQAVYTRQQVQTADKRNKQTHKEYARIAPAEMESVLERHKKRQSIRENQAQSCNIKCCMKEDMLPLEEADIAEKVAVQHVRDYFLK
eukprot:3367292-Amphidinium_carterae.1